MSGSPSRRMRLFGLLALGDLLIFVFLSLVGCTPKRPIATEPTTYHGITPCADCAGVATALTLNPSGGYLLESRRLGTALGSKVERGVAKRRGSSKLTLWPEVGEQPYYLELTDSSARWLAVWARSVADDTSGAYVLRPGPPVRIGPGERELFVDSAREACRDAEGGLDSCLRVLRPEGAGGADWETLPTDIQGFAYGPGRLYHLVVREEADRISLVRSVSEAPDARLAAHDTYELEALGGAPLVLPQGAQRPTLVLDVVGERIVGTDGCNRYQARLEALGVEQVQFGPLAGTRKACMESVGAVAKQYRDALRAARSYCQTTGRALRLLDARGQPVATFRREA